MPRTARMIVPDEAAVYHVMSRTAMDGFPMGGVEKDFLLTVIQPSALPAPVFYRFGNYWIKSIRFPPLPAFQASFHVQKRENAQTDSGRSGIYSLKRLSEMI